MKCTQCPKIALYRVCEAGYCREHYQEAVRATAREKKSVEAHHSVKVEDWAAKYGNRRQA